MDNTIHSQRLLETLKEEMNASLKRFEESPNTEKVRQLILSKIQETLMQLYDYNLHIPPEAIQFDIVEDPPQLITLKPKNLFTALLGLGIHVPYKEVKGRLTYDHSGYGLFRFNPDTNVMDMLPKMPAEEITVTFTIDKDGVNFD